MNNPEADWEPDASSHHSRHVGTYEQCSSNTDKKPSERIPPPDLFGEAYSYKVMQNT